jgi:hypothetical protein
MKIYREREKGKKHRDNTQRLNIELKKREIAIEKQETGRQVGIIN